MKWIFSKLGVSNKEEFKDLVIQFIKFGLVGASNTAVSFGIYYLFLFIDEDLYMVGTVLGTILSILNAFIWNDLFVFKGNEKDFKSIMKRLGKTYVSYGGTSLLSIFLVWLEVSIIGIPKAIAPIINLFITIPLNFVINKLWTFAKSSDKAGVKDEQ